MEPPPPVAVKLEHVSWNENTTTAATNTTGTSSTILEAPHSMMGGEETEDALQKKRTALAGQWRTPPTPFFSSGGNGGSYDGLPVLGTNHPATTTTSTNTSTTTSEDPNGTTTTTNVGLTTATAAATIPVVTVPGLLLQEDHVINAILPIAPPMSLPHSTEDYAKALQEAYRRGAEAAARAAALQQPPPAVVAPSSSGPDLQLPLTTMSHGPPSTASVSSMMNRTSLSSSPTLMIHPTSLAAPASSSSSSSLTAANASTASTAMEANVSEPQPMQVQVVHHHHHHHILPAAAPPSHSSSTNTALPSHGTELSSAVMPITTSPTAGTAPRMMNIDPNHNNNKTAPIQVVSSHPPPPPVTTLHQPSTDLSGMTSTTTTPASNPTTILPMNSTTTATKQQQQHQQRSVSLPDMSSYAAQQEEEKRQKRLARNRASARLRRLRKKNLVDAYEVEVGHLEKTMAQLQQHEWGCTNSSHTTGVQSATVLAEALSMDRGQQKLSVAERNKAATDILQQQLQFLQQLEDLMQEQYVLQQVAQFTLNGGETDTLNEWKDLQETLQLSPDQCQQIVDQSTGWDSEWQALQTVKSSLVAMRDNDWLWNEGCAGITDQFMAILHSNQISKLLLWADHNAETIEELDSVHAIHVVPDTPIFQFGMDNNPNEYMDDERMAA